MEKEIKIKFTAQSNKVVEEVSIRYFGDEKEFDSEKYLNDNILKETIDLQRKAESHSLTGVFRR